MNVLNDRFKSDYGWSMSPPQNWVRLRDSSGEPVLSPSKAVSFANPNNWDAYMAWMTRGFPVSQEVAQAFASTVTSSSLTQDGISQLVNAIFPLIGSPDRAAVINLEDGSKALEVTETYNEDGEVKRSYQLIFPRYQSRTDQSGYPDMFQRISYYAPDGLFKQHLEEVQRAARSFKYD